ncbi:unnamed protein product [Pseudo-nitzschia multistriata]|uniref:Uncharacterized protein n=1 Tax=Pseudo-nitzschia multistriata TaxID=183589 RepID=A0A448YVJ5_9STRA|nr:unnamed protein product [Pseudo-nitzschia multistriata]
MKRILGKQKAKQKERDDDDEDIGGGDADVNAHHDENLESYRSSSETTTDGPEDDADEVYRHAETDYDQRERGSDSDSYGSEFSEPSSGDEEDDGDSYENEGFDEDYQARYSFAPDGGDYGIDPGDASHHVVLMEDEEDMGDSTINHSGNTTLENSKSNSNSNSTGSKHRHKPRGGRRKEILQSGDDTIDSKKVDHDQQQEQEEETPAKKVKKKRGFFGRLFGKKAGKKGTGFGDSKRSLVSADSVSRASSKESKAKKKKKRKNQREEEEEDQHDVPVSPSIADSEGQSYSVMDDEWQSQTGENQSYAYSVVIDDGSQSFDDDGSSSTASQSLYRQKGVKGKQRKKYFHQMPGVAEEDEESYNPSMPGEEGEDDESYSINIADDGSSFTTFQTMEDQRGLQYPPMETLREETDEDQTVDNSASFHYNSNEEDTDIGHDIDSMHRSERVGDPDTEGFDADAEGFDAATFDAATFDAATFDAAAYDAESFLSNLAKKSDLKPSKQNKPSSKRSSKRSKKPSFDADAETFDADTFDAAAYDAESFLSNLAKKSDLKPSKQQKPSSSSSLKNKPSSKRSSKRSKKPSSNKMPSISSYALPPLQNINAFQHSLGTQSSGNSSPASTDTPFSVVQIHDLQTEVDKLKMLVSLLVERMELYERQSECLVEASVAHNTKWKKATIRKYDRSSKRKASQSSSVARLSTIKGLMEEQGVMDTWIKQLETVQRGYRDRLEATTNQLKALRYEQMLTNKQIIELKREKSKARHTSVSKYATVIEVHNKPGSSAAPSSSSGDSGNKGAKRDATNRAQQNSLVEDMMSNWQAEQQHTSAALGPHFIGKPTSRSNSFTSSHAGSSYTSNSRRKKKDSRKKKKKKKSEA